MGALRKVVVIFALFVVLAVNLSHADQQGSHQKQIRIRRQVAEDAVPEEVAQENSEPEDAAQENQAPADDDQVNEEQGSRPDYQKEEDTEDNTQMDLRFPFWTTCNYGVDPIKSCYDCNRLIICKRIGGLMKRCGNPYRPHCNNGTCSSVPSAECA